MYIPTHLSFYRNKERKDAMLNLMKMTREGMLGLWDEHFKAILLILLETLGDDDVSIVDVLYMAKPEYQA